MVYSWVSWRPVVQVGAPARAAIGGGRFDSGVKAGTAMKPVFHRAAALRIEAEEELGPAHEEILGRARVFIFGGMFEFDERYAGRDLAGLVRILPHRFE